MADTTQNKPEFSVYWWDIDGNQNEELRFVLPEVAMSAVTRLTKGPGKMFVHRVIITDGGDLTNFEWVAGKVIFPTKEDLARASGC